MYSPSTYSIVQADPSLIQLTILCKTCWKDLLRPYLFALITVFAVELKQTVKNFVSSFCFCF